MAFFETPPVPNASRRPNESSGAHPSVHYLREDSSLFGPEPLHQLLRNSHDIFCILQTNKVGENKSTDYTADYGYNIVDVDPSTLNLVHISKAYRYIKFLQSSYNLIEYLNVSFNLKIWILSQNVPARLHPGVAKLRRQQ